MRSFTVWPAACWNRLIRGWVFFCRDIREGKLMKKAIIAVFMLSGIFLSWGYGQKNTADTESPEVSAEVEKLISKAEANAKRPYELNGVMQEFDRKRAYTKFAGTKLRRNVSIRLIRIYNSQLSG